MDEVAADIERQITANRAWRRVQRVRGADGVAHHLHGTRALDAGDYHRPAGDVLEQAGIEALAFMLGVVPRREVTGYLHQLQANDLQAARFETGENGPNEAALHAIWLDD